MEPTPEDNFDRIEQEVLDVLRDEYGFEPSSSTLTPEAEAAAALRARASLADLLPASTQQERTHPHRGRRIRAGALVAGIAASVITGCLVLWQGTQPEDRPQSPNEFLAVPTLLTPTGVGEWDDRLDASPADFALSDLATTAAAQPRLADEDVVRTIEVASWTLPNQPTSSVVPTITEIQQGAKGELQVQHKKGQPLTAAGKISPSTDQRGFVLGQSPTGIPDLEALPENPVALARSLAANCDTKAICLFDAIALLGQNRVLEPAQSVVLLRMLIGVDDIGYLGTVNDRVGRTSAVFTIESKGDEQRLLLFDTTTGLYSGDERVLLSGSVRAGLIAPAVTAFHAVISRHVATGRRD